MKRAATMLVAITIAVAACGDDDAEQPSPPDVSVAPTAAPISPEAPTGAATTAATAGSPEAPAATTAAPQTTVTPAETTTTAAALSGPDAFIAAAVDFIGTYEGT